MEAPFEPTPRTRLRRSHERGHYDRQTVHAILDASPICHVGYMIDGQPYVTPTCHWREGERLYWHGSSASRMLRQAKDAPVCVTVTHLDGLVLARSGFHHSINYRSVMAFGTARKVPDEDKLVALKVVRRSASCPAAGIALRPPTTQEIKATTVSVDGARRGRPPRFGGGPPIDDEEDYALPIWAGVQPLSDHGRSPSSPIQGSCPGDRCAGPGRGA